MGEPVSLPDAKALAEEDPYQFQWWALSLVDARPVEQKEAASAGFYKSGSGTTHPRLQLLTIEELLAGKGIHMPPRKYVDRTFKRAPKAKRKGPDAPTLPFGGV